MANDAKINLQVEFAPQIENIKKHKEDLGGLKDPSGKSALDKNPQLVRDLDLLIESIDKLSKVANPGHSEISALVQALVKANEIVLKLANSEGVLSKEMTEKTGRKETNSGASETNSRSRLYLYGRKESVPGRSRARQKNRDDF